MKPYLSSHMLFCLVFINLASCKKDQASKNDSCRLPYCHYLQLNYGSYIEIPDHAALNPASGITLEGWVRLDNYAAANYFVYKKSGTQPEGYYIQVTAYNEQHGLSSYIGKGGKKKSGIFPVHTWTHWAVTSDGQHRRHYINGHLAAEFEEEQERSLRTEAPLLLGKAMAAHSGLAEFRLWNVVRTANEINANMNKKITAPEPGLIAVWPLEKNAHDAIGSHDGVLHNQPAFKIWAP